MTQTDYMCQEKDKDSPAFRIAWMNQYKNLRNTSKIAKKELLQQPVTAMATEN